jgi:hypothetical protein
MNSQKISTASRIGLAIQFFLGVCLFIIPIAYMSFEIISGQLPVAAFGMIVLWTLCAWLYCKHIFLTYHIVVGSDGEIIARHVITGKGYHLLSEKLVVKEIPMISVIFFTYKLSDGQQSFRFQYWVPVPKLSPVDPAEIAKGLTKRLREASKTTNE